MFGYPSSGSLQRLFARSASRSRRSMGSIYSIEPLENRTMLTAVFDAVLGPETLKQNGDAKMQSPPINLIFWGSFWGGPGSLRSEAVRDAFSQILHSTYFSITNQYGADGASMFLNDTVFNSSDPPASIGGSQIDQVVQDQIDAGHLPESDDGRPPVYVVVTPPGVSSPNASGFNQVGSDFDPPLDFDSIGEAWVGTEADSGLGFNMDSMTSTFSHEIAEIMTDFGQGGYEVNPPAQWTAAGFPDNHQIGDNEPGGQNYNFRLSNGFDVQALWSAADQAYVVNDGTTQTFNFHPNWGINAAGMPVFKQNFALTVNGDQLGPNFDDRVNLSRNAAGGITLMLNGETLNFDLNYLSGITLNLGGGDNSVVMDTRLQNGVTLSMNAAGGVIDLKGPDQTTTWDIKGADSGTFTSGSTQLYTFSDVANLVGGAAGDKFKFFPGGSLSGSIDGLGSTSTALNSLDFSQFTDQVNVNLQTHTATPIAGTFSNISVITGGANPLNTLTGPDAGGLWSINSAGGAGSGTVGGFTFTSFANLVGGSGNDTFQFQPGTPEGSVPGNLDGGGGANTLDYSQLAGPITINLKTHTATDIGGTFANIGSVIGSQSTSDTIIGPDASWIIDGTNSGSVNGFTFSSIENLQGNKQDDTFAFEPGGSISGNLDGGAGVNTLDFSALAAPVTIDFATGSIPGLVGGTFGHITNVIGGPGGFSVIGPDAPTTWTITGINTVSAFGLTFTDTPSITGGSANDTFVFLDGGRLDGTIDGGGGTNTLDDSHLATDVIVDLSTHAATAIGQGIFNLQNLIGGKADNLLVGDAGSNTLIGGAGRNVLIGDGGADALNGGGGDNIVIGDATIWDANMPALLAIFAEWTRIDLSFEQRIADLLGGGGGRGLNGGYTLASKNIRSDGFSDTLIGGAGANWFFVTNHEDVIGGNRNPRDHITTLQ